MYRKVLPIFIGWLTLSSCTVNDVNQIKQVLDSDDPKQAISQYAKHKRRVYGDDPQALLQDIQDLTQLLGKLDEKVRRIWGKNSQLPTRNKYVKYTNNYQSLAEVDFAKGVVRITTIASHQPRKQLQQAIVTTLLTTEDPHQTDIFSDKAPMLQGKPYLLGEVLDHDGQSIAYPWRANRFAQYLIQNKLQQGVVASKTSYFVEIDMVRDHQHLRQQKYADIVLAASNRYKVAPELIYAIIETESSFNPFAVSSANAYGLMQVIPATAGKDVYQRVMNKSGAPTREVLFRVEDNIMIGTAYLHLLQTHYLASINRQLSRQYAVISAYNGGAGNVAKTFSGDRKRAWQLINRLNSPDVYQQLTTRHPKAESRRYLQKVIKAKKKY